MIYTIRQMINCREAQEGQKPRWQGQTPVAVIDRYALKRAPIGHVMPRFGASTEGAEMPEILVFSANIAI